MINFPERIMCCARFGLFVPRDMFTLWAVIAMVRPSMYTVYIHIYSIYQYIMLCHVMYPLKHIHVLVFAWVERHVSWTLVLLSLRSHNYL